jgi:hypothetical protein
MQEEYNSFLENQTWDMVPIWFPFLLGGNFSDANGSTGPRAQWMDRSTDTKPGLSPKAFSRFMVLAMMRPLLQ